MIDEQRAWVTLGCQLPFAIILLCCDVQAIAWSAGLIKMACPTANAGLCYTGPGMYPAHPYVL